MSWRARRKAKKADEAYKKLHGVGAFPVPPRRRHRSYGGGTNWEVGDLADVISDATIALIEALFKIFD